MQKQGVGQISSDGAKAREIAEQYSQIEESTEILTQISRYNLRVKKVVLSGKLMVDMRGYFCLIVQLTYLLYTCLIRNINLFVGNDYFTRPPKKWDVIPMYDIYIEYLLEADYNRMTVEEQAEIAHRFRFVELIKSQSCFADFIFQFVSKIRILLKVYLERIRLTPEGFYFRQMEGLGNIIDNFLLVQVKHLTPKAVILCLEESQVFRQYSLLLKCFNSSVYVNIRSFPHWESVFSNLLKIDKNLENSLKQKKDVEQNVKRLQNSIEESLKELLKNKVIAVEHSITENTKKEEGKAKPYTLGSLDVSNFDNRKYASKIYIKERPFKLFTSNSLKDILMFIKINEAKGDLDEQRIEKSKKLFENNIQQQQSQRHQFLIEFFANKNLLSIKYMTNLELNIENADLLMFHCNFVSYGWNSIALQFVQRVAPNSKRKERCIAFKNLCYISHQDKIIFKILIMIDVLMVYVKTIEAHLRKNIFNFDEYCSKNAELNDKCDHIKRLFISKIERMYQVLQDGTKSDSN